MGIQVKGIPNNQGQILFVKIIFMVEQLPLYLSLMTKTHVKNFGPFTEGFIKIAYDLEAWSCKSSKHCSFGRANTRRSRSLYLAKVIWRKLCAAHNVLFIADEGTN
jgi:ornithine--oxo-acid transaminase